MVQEKMIKVLIADDHPVVLEGLKFIISQTSDIVVKDEARDGEEVIDKVKRNFYNLVILDFSMPKKDGLEVIKVIKKIKQYIPILVLSIHPEEFYAIKCIQEGASGYLTKESIPEELIKAIRRVAQGRMYITSSVAENIACSLSNLKRSNIQSKLSNREFQIMCLLASGKRIKEIAQSLRLSINTVSTYKSRILIKLNLKNTSELIYYAIKNKIIE